ncbi:hypothetical protein LCGC14_1031790 [marine sediment metagenome]|uniref:Uncharacterized protein n=1 Tax=marine sediment metagenome TaxID=412755 RepID=A0A0F9MYV7_9ZZZZ
MFRDLKKHKDFDEFMFIHFNHMWKLLIYPEEQAKEIMKKIKKELNKCKQLRII